MSLTVDPRLLRDIKRYGAFDISACFHCGNCTAVCPLSDQHGSFPRRLIRLGQIGDRSRLLSGPEAWLCYYCGECSETCPRQAEPGEYMAAVRRYAVAAAEPTGVAGGMFRSAGMTLLVTLLLGTAMAGFLASAKVGHNPAHWLFGMSYEALHWIGVGVFVIAGLAAAVGAGATLRRMLRGMAGAPRPDVAAIVAALRRTLTEVAAMRRHREPSPGEVPPPWYRRTAWVHMAIMFGFLGLLLATTLDLVFLVVLPLGLSIFWPARIIGTVAGAAMLWGVSAALLRRARGAERSLQRSFLSDWWLLGFLLVLAITGFWLEVVVTLRMVGPVSDAVLLVHAAMAMELVLLMTFTKLAHVLYRPMALFVYHLRQQGQ